MYKIFLNVIREGKLLGEIGGILDELHIMLHIQDQQKRVLRGFSKHVARLLSVSKLTIESTDRRMSRADLRALGPAARLGDDWQVDSCAVDPAKNNMLHARDLIENLDDHISDLVGLEETAMQISASVSVFLLKLQSLVC
jgi:hypothetical protein